jgi:hypothetical protein
MKDSHFRLTQGLPYYVQAVQWNAEDDTVSAFQSDTLVGQTQTSFLGSSEDLKEAI